MRAAVPVEVEVAAPAAFVDEAGATRTIGGSLSPSFVLMTMAGTTACSGTAGTTVATAVITGTMGIDWRLLVPTGRRRGLGAAVPLAKQLLLLVALPWAFGVTVTALAGAATVAPVVSTARGPLLPTIRLPPMFADGEVSCAMTAGTGAGGGTVA